MTLGQKRRLFTAKLSELIAFINARSGYEAQLDETKRHAIMCTINEYAGKGIANSLHKLGLAADIDIFYNGNLLENSEDYHFAAKWWKSNTTADAEFAWGGDFSKPDGRHFSVAHGGIR